MRTPRTSESESEAKKSGFQYIVMSSYCWSNVTPAVGMSMVGTLRMYRDSSAKNGVSCRNAMR